MQEDEGRLTNWCKKTKEDWLTGARRRWPYVIISAFSVHLQFFSSGFHIFLCLKSPNHLLIPQWRAGKAQWLERRIRDRKVAGLSPGRSDRRYFFSGVNFLCWLLFRYPFYPRVGTAAARKRSRSFYQRCGWQVSSKHIRHPTYVALHEVTLWTGTWPYGVHRRQ